MNVEKAESILNKYYKQQLNKLILNDFPKNDINFLKVKFNHSFDCYYICNEIIDEDDNLRNESEDFKNKAKVICLLHDLGRFFELTKELEGKEHGYYGADLLQKVELLSEKEILIPIRHHDERDIDLDLDEDYKALDEKSKKETLKLLILLRDVDKISNLYLFKKDNTIYTRKDKKYGLSEEYFEALKNKTIIDKKYKNTIFDSIIYYIIWIYELNYKGSRDFANKNKLLEHLLKMFEFYIYDVEKNELKQYSESEVLKRKNLMLQYFQRIKEILKEEIN